MKTEESARKLRNPDIDRIFCTSLHIRLEALNLLDVAGESDVENMWTSVESVHHNVAKTNIGFKKRKKKELISHNTW